MKLQAEQVNYSVRLKNLAKVRNHLGMTLRELAKKAGLSVGFLNDLEHGRRTISRKPYLRLERALEAMKPKHLCRYCNKPVSDQRAVKNPSGYFHGRCYAKRIREMASPQTVKPKHRRTDRRGHRYDRCQMNRTWGECSIACKKLKIWCRCGKRRPTGRES